ncbi:MAG TPA: DUF3105 domain-containing protein [Candidatus Limnocylindria bacterium]|nr:DUF3105 domain-containing protein [Candidatus Limnocylindria bacterium]
MSTRHDRRERQRAQRGKKARRGAQGAGFRLSGWMTAAILGGVAVLAIFGLRAAGFFEPPAPPIDLSKIATPSPGAKIGVHKEDKGATHVTTGQRVPYAEKPPTSGPHWEMPHAGWGVKDQPQDDEKVVHNLEHGGIAIQYKPGLEPQQLSDLKTLVRQLNSSGFPKILLRPYVDMDKNIVAVAWNWRLDLDAFDQTQLVQFVRAHYGTAGEAGEPNSP